MIKPTVREGYVSMTGSNKVELVELITKQKSSEFLEWLEIAQDPKRGAVRITPEEMDKVYVEVMRFRKNRASYHKGALNYYLPAFNAIEEAYRKRDFDRFRAGLDNLLGLIGGD